MAFRKKICWSCLILLCMAIFAVWSLTSCYETNFDELKGIPLIEQKQEQKYKLYTRKDLGFAFNHGRGHNFVQLDVSRDTEILMLDRHFREVDYFFFQKFNKWFKEVKFENGIMPINQNETLDCDNFAMLYKSLMSVSSYKSNIEHEPAVALIIVEQKYSFGGVPPGALHMLNLVFASNAWYVFEPQTGKYIKLEHYPNQKYIRTIII